MTIKSLFIKGTNTKTKPAKGYAVTITMPLPKNLWDMRDELNVVCSAKGALRTPTSSFKQINGTWCVVFETDHFSPYALVVGIANGLHVSSESVLPYYFGGKGKKISEAPTT